MIDNRARTAYLFLRVGVAFAFLYPPLSAIFGDPYTWLGYFPQSVRGLALSLSNGFVDDLLLLHAFGVVEILIALWILSGYKIFLPALGATVLLLAIVVFNFSQMDVVFRDLSIAAAALSLALINWPRTLPV
ncbi:hypothetical protein EXS62_00290 [Candidatus Kaiserbacteria bacterium]|nr:hypothetical protein [Candidatus Kaiserbacteria bacterium]